VPPGPLWRYALAKGEVLLRGRGSPRLRYALPGKRVPLLCARLPRGIYATLFHGASHAYRCTPSRGADRFKPGRARL